MSVSAMAKLGSIVILLTLFGGCAGPENPSFPLSVKDSKAALQEMKQDPKPLDRPLVLVAGYGDPGYVDAYLEKKMAPCFSDDRIVGIAFTNVSSFDECRDLLIQLVDDSFGADDPDSTIEVDVVANSMGGVIARYAADPSVGRYLRVARMFTISAPHRGAAMARINVGNQLLVDMRPGSEFLNDLNERNLKPEYELFPYARLGDLWVGQENTAPPGQVPWWVANRPFEPAHLASFSDPRIHADILRRLRNEPPFTREPRAPWPSE